MRISSESKERRVSSHVNEYQPLNTQRFAGLKVARLDFFRGIPFKHSLRRHEQRYGKKVTATVLYKDENFL